MTRWLSSVLAAVALPVLGCSASTNDTPGTEPKAADPEPSCVASSGYPGDANCIAPPPPAAGFQLHYGPTDHDDPDEVARYLVAPGDEGVNCYAMKTANAEDVFSVGYQFHMRPGSHHLIVQTQASAIPDGPIACGAVSVAPSALGGTQTQITDSVAETSTENRGLAIQIAARTQAVLNFHVVNTTTEPLLSEAWLNYLYADESEVTGFRGSVFLAGGFAFRIAPATKKTYQYSCSPAKPSRILSLAAHMHEHAHRMTAWKVADGERTKVLESFDWEEPGTVYFDELHKNAVPDAASHRTGADYSGTLVLQPGEQLQWECEVENDGDETLTFRNEVRTGEMCVVTGSQVNADDPTKLSDFNCVRN